MTAIWSRSPSSVISMGSSAETARARLWDRPRPPRLRRRLDADAVAGDGVLSWPAGWSVEAFAARAVAGGLRRGVPSRDPWAVAGASPTGASSVGDASP